VSELDGVGDRRGLAILPHVNDPEFWIVKSYLGRPCAERSKTWSVMGAVFVVGRSPVLVHRHFP
jgi:H+/gluconate symporter-like permease